MEPSSRPAEHRLLIANRTLDDAAVETVLRARPHRTRWTVVVPATPPGATDEAFLASEHLRSWGGEAPGVMLARLRLHRALERLTAAGLHVQGQVADPDPVRAAASVLHGDPAVEIVLAMLPGDRSMWRRQRVAQRLEGRHHVVVTSVTTTDGQPTSRPTRRRRLSRGATGR